MFWVIFIAIIFIAIMMVSSSDSKNAAALSGQFPEDENWKKWQNTRMTDAQNQPLYDKFMEIYNSCEPLYDNSVVTSEEAKELVEQISSITNEVDADYILAIQFALSQSRYPSPTAPSTGIQLHPREKCYFKTKNSIFNTVQKLYKNVNYSGLRYNVGAYRMGSMTLNSKDVEGYRPFGYGCCYVTNQRIVFNTQDNKNKVIPLGTIVSYAPYEENAVLLNIANSTPVIINFPCTGMFNITSQGGMVFFTDDKMHFLYALDEVLESRRR